MKKKWISGIGCALSIAVIISYFNITKTTPYQTKSAVLPMSSNSELKHAESSTVRDSPKVPVIQTASKTESHKLILQEIRICEQEISNYIAKEDELDYESVSNKFKHHFAVESQLAYGLTEELKDRIVLFEQLNEAFPNHPLVEHALISACAISTDLCKPTTVAKLIGPGQQNGAIWLIAAINALNQNDKELALEYLKESTRAPIYDDYWGEYISNFDIALEQAGIDNILSRKVTVLGYGAALAIPAFASLTDFCKNTDASNQ